MINNWVTQTAICQWYHMSNLRQMFYTVFHGPNIKVVIPLVAAPSDIALNPQVL